jgi:hypothetical protein
MLTASCSFSVFFDILRAFLLKMADLRATFRAQMPINLNSRLGLAQLEVEGPVRETRGGGVDSTHTQGNDPGVNHHCWSGRRPSALTDLILGHPGIYSNLLELQHTIMYFTTLRRHLTRANAGLSS